MQFEEDGEIVEMEIDNGGKALRQFASEDDHELAGYTSDDNLSDQETAIESGEVTPNQSEVEEGHASAEDK